MAAWPGPPPLKEWQEDVAEWLEANRACHDDVLALLRSDGPLPARALPDTCVVPWRSSGWNDDRNVRMLVGLLEARGEVAVAAREGRERLWDLAERVFPDSPAVPLEEASRRARPAPARRARHRPRRRPRSTPWSRTTSGRPGADAVVEGVRGTWRVDPALLDQPFRGRTALLSPLDRLVADRKRMGELFGFDYQLEMYKPVAARKWGYWAMPVLHGDRLVGKVDATADRDRGVLRVDAVHWDEESPAAVAGRRARAPFAGPVAGPGARRGPPEPVDNPAAPSDVRPRVVDEGVADGGGPDRGYFRWQHSSRSTPTASPRPPATSRGSRPRSRGRSAVMMARLTGLQDAWTGSASAQFQGVVGQWRGTQQQVRASLDAIGQVLGAAGTQYAEAEAQAVRLFT